MYFKPKVKPLVFRVPFSKKGKEFSVIVQAQEHC